MRKIYPSDDDDHRPAEELRHKATTQQNGQCLIITITTTIIIMKYIYTYIVRPATGKNSQGTPYYYNARMNIYDRWAGRRGETVVHCV